MRPNGHRFTACSMALFAILFTGIASHATAQSSSNTGRVYIEAEGVVVGEAELYSTRTPSPAGKSWLIVPDEATGAGPRVASARGGRYVQLLPDDFTPGRSPTSPPSIEYKMKIVTLGTYRLFLRWDGNATNNQTKGESDSLFVDIVELKDGPGNTVADWYEPVRGITGDFANSGWDGSGGFEENIGISTDIPMTWVIARPDVYTLRISQREDGAAVDAFIFQLASLPAPVGGGPPTSAADVDLPLTRDTVLLRYDAAQGRLAPDDLAPGFRRSGEVLRDVARLKGAASDVPLVYVSQGVNRRWYLGGGTTRTDVTDQLRTIFGFDSTRVRVTKLDGRWIAIAFDAVGDLWGTELLGVEPASQKIIHQPFGNVTSVVASIFGFVPVDLTFISSTRQPSGDDDRIRGRTSQGEVWEHRWDDIKRGVKTGVKLDVASAFGDPGLTSTIALFAFDKGDGDSLYAVRLARFAWTSTFENGFEPWSYDSWSFVSRGQGGRAEVVEDPTFSGRGKVQRSTVGGGGPPIEEPTIAPGYLVYRLYPAKFFPFQPAPCYAKMDVWASRELVDSVMDYTNQTVIGPDIFDKTVEDGGAFTSALQVKLARFSASPSGRRHLRLFYPSPPGQLAGRVIGSLASDAPEFTVEQWSTVRVTVFGDRSVALDQDGRLISEATLTEDSRAGTVGGHPGIYGHQRLSEPHPLAGTLLVDNYEIKCW